MRELEAAYAQLTLAEQFRANTGVIVGFVAAIALSLALKAVGVPSIFSLATLDFNFITSAFAQSPSPASGSGGLPTPLIYAINLVLLALMLGCFYAAIILKNTTMIVRNTSKTLLGYFVGKLVK